jgi:hypothetical protein
MRKRNNNDPTLGVDKAKVRVFFAEVEGNNDSVQEALKTMVSAMSRSVRVISEHKSNGAAALLPSQTDAEDVEEAVEQTEEVEAAGEDFAPASVRKPRVQEEKLIATLAWSWCRT